MNAGGGIFYSFGRLWAASPMAGPLEEIYLSEDSARTWTKQSFIFSGVTTVNNIIFASSLFGVIQANIGSSYCSYTTDGAKNWASSRSILASPFILLSSNAWISSSSISRDTGRTWQGYCKSGDLPYVVGRDNTGVAFCSGADVFYITHDSGYTWKRLTPQMDLNSWSADGYRSCYDTVIYIANNDDVGIIDPKWPWSHNHECDLFVTHDDGKTFQSYYKPATPDDRLTGVVKARKHGLVYASTYAGVIMSTDFGVTWKGIGGPRTLIDFFSFDVINDSTLVLLDSTGSVWMCEHIPIPKVQLERPVTTGFSLTNIPACDSGASSVSLQHRFCSPLYVLGASLTSKTPTCFSLSNHTYPDTLSPNGIFSLDVGFNPNKQVGLFNGGVRVHAFYLDEGDTMWVDTTIFFSGASKAVAPQFTAAPTFLSFGKVSTCGQPVDTVITITNQGCDSLRITSGPGALPPEFTLVSPQPLVLPITLAPGASASFRFRFFPSATTTYNATGLFKVNQQGIEKSITFILDGEGVKEGGVFNASPMAFDFKSLSICSRDSASGTIKNTGCDSISIFNSQYFGDIDFSQYFGDAGITGLKLGPLQQINYSVYLNPAKKGVRQGFIVFTSDNGSGVTHDTVRFTVTVTDGTRILSSSRNTLDFGTTSLCENRDTTFTLTNSGCDTLTINTIDLQGSGFSSTTQTPIIIYPGQSTTIRVTTQLDTAGGKLSNSDTINFTTDADNTIPPITLSRAYSLPKHYSVHLASSGIPQGKNGDVVSFDLVSDDAQLPGVQSIDYDLGLNSDLLEYLNYTSPNTVTITGNHIHIQGNPLIQQTANGSLATFNYRVYLTKDSTSTITATNLHLNNTDPSFEECVATVASTGDTAFSYIYVCGDHILQDFLRTGKLTIESLSPNPTNGMITITLKSPVKETATMRIYDLLGKEVQHDTQTLLSGTNQLTIDTKPLPEGSYIIEFTTPTGQTKQRFVRQ